MVMAVVSKNHLKVYNLGDSRAYLLQKDTLRCLTKDHTTSIIRPYSNQRSHSLSQYLGIPEEEFIIEPYCTDIELLAGDKILLSSDGLTDMLGEDTIKNILMEDMHPKGIAKKLLDAAIAEGGKDNITALVLAC
jgi:protein phosphatase